jgi:hypothetical protein
LPPQSILDLWTAEESDREAAAAQNGGRYYPATALELIYNEIADCEYRLNLALNESVLQGVNHRSWRSMLRTRMVRRLAARLGLAV